MLLIQLLSTLFLIRKRLAWIPTRFIIHSFMVMEIIGKMDLIKIMNLENLASNVMYCVYVCVCTLYYPWVSQIIFFITWAAYIGFPLHFPCSRLHTVELFMVLITVLEGDLSPQL